MEKRFFFSPNVLLGKSATIVFIQGLLFVMLGVVSLIHPALAIRVTTILAGALLIVYGIERLSLMRRLPLGGWGLAWSILSVFAGIFCLVMPALASIELVVFVGIWMIFSGTDQMIGAFQMARGSLGRSMIFFNGIISLIFGFLIFCFPIFGVVMVGYLIGFYLLYFGFLACAVSVLVHKGVKDSESPAGCGIK